MKKMYKYGLIVCVSTFVLGGPSFAADPTAKKDQYQLQQQDKYGWELMSEQERAEHREKMRSMHTEQERAQYREEHHKMMQERAKERGVTIPDMPASDGGHGQGMGMGKKSGGGK